MNRDSESRLLAFCVEQRSRFEASAWLSVSGAMPLEIATVARYLGGVAWYGHAEELREIAGRITSHSFSQLVGECGFDPSRFGSLLKAHLQQAHRSVAV